MIKNIKPIGNRGTFHIDLSSLAFCVKRSPLYTDTKHVLAPKQSELILQSLMFCDH